jgi:3',5'-cyclic AMP phosphodiesterase CpdA
MAFSFIQITDHHLRAAETDLVRGMSTDNSLRTVLRHIARHAAPRADFIVSMGDFIDPPSDAAYLAVLSRLGIECNGAAAPGPLQITSEGLRAFPIYFVPGNHDDRDAFFRCLFPNAAPMPLMNVRFQYQGVQFICLDWGTDATSVVYPETLDFLARALQTDLPSVILTHHQVAPVGVAWLDAFIAPEMPRFWEIVRGKHIVGILAGHVHMTHEQLVAGIPVLTLRSTAFQFARNDEPLVALQPPHYRFVTIHNDVLTSRIFEVPL